MRAGLVAFIVAALLGVFLSLPTFHPSYAQAPAAPADVPTPACDPKMLLNYSVTVMTSFAVTRLVTARPCSDV